MLPQRAAGATYQRYRQGSCWLVPRCWVLVFHPQLRSYGVRYCHAADNFRDANVQIAPRQA